MNEDITVTTAFDMPGFRTLKVLGVLQGGICQSKSLVGKVGAAFQRLVGGNVTRFKELCEKTRIDAFHIMLAHERALKTNAIEGMRYDSTEVMAISDGKEREKAVARFRAEAQILAELRHPGLPRVVEYFEEGGYHFLAMDYIEGQSLKHYMEVYNPFPDIELVITWAEALAETLHFLHSRQPPILFPDLIPANVILSRDGHLKLIDFGISRLIMPAHIAGPGAHGTDSTGFSPPEHFSGTTDARSDIYSLGALTYYLLMGTPPVDALSRRTKNIPLLSTTERNPLATKETDQVLFKALEMNPKKRFQSVEDFQKALGTLRKAAT